MKKLMLLFTALSFMLAACSNDKDTKEQAEDITPELIEVTINTPEKIMVNEEITIEALVVQGKDKIKNADEVKFEIWKSGQDEHEMLQALNEKDGTYTVKKAFTEGGQYFIVAHTTANSLHSMPKKEVTVEALKEDTAAHTDFATDHDHEDQHGDAAEHNHSDHHGSMVNFDFHVHSRININETTDLTVNLTQADQPLSEATVRYEIWGENQEKHEFIDTRETSAGAYTAPFTFAAKGTYHVKIHVEKGNLHVHTEKTIDVK
jgi:hypothetical protein